MREKLYRVHLTKNERKRLEEIVSRGVHPARQVRRAHILLLLDEGEGPGRAPVKTPKQSEIARQCHCNTVVVYTVSRQYAQEGLERVLNRKKRETPPVPAKVTGDIEANKPPRMGAGKIQTAGTAMCAVKGETREEAPDTDLGLYSGEYRVLIGSFNAVGGLYGQYQGT